MCERQRHGTLLTGSQWMSLMLGYHNFAIARMLNTLDICGSVIEPKN